MTATPGWDALVAHQLKTPLAAIEARLTDAQGEEANCRRELRRMARLIDQLQLVGRARSGVEGQRVDLAETARRACLDLLPLAERRGQRIGLRLFGQVVLQDADPLLLGEAISNLVENALRYGPRGGAVDVVLSAGGNLMVLDRGPGVPAVIRGDLFEPFRRGTTGSGAGLGLHLVDRVARSHGGRVVYLPRIGGGSVFTMVFADKVPS